MAQQLERGCTPVSVESTLSSIHMTESSYGGDTVTAKALQDVRSSNRMGPTAATNGHHHHHQPNTIPSSTTGVRKGGHLAQQRTTLASSGNALVNVMGARSDPGATSFTSGLVGIVGGGVSTNTADNNHQNTHNNRSGAAEGGHSTSTWNSSWLWKARKGAGGDVKGGNTRGTGQSRLVLNLPVQTQIDFWRYSALYLLICSGVVIAHVGLNKCSLNQTNQMEATFNSLPAVVDLLLLLWTVISLFLSCGAAAHSLWSESNHPIPFYVCAFFVGIMYILRMVAVGSAVGGMGFPVAMFFMLESPIRFTVLPLSIVMVLVAVVLDLNQMSSGSALSDSLLPSSTTMSYHSSAECSDSLGTTLRGAMALCYQGVPFVASIFLAAFLRYGPVRESELELAHHVLKHLSNGNISRARGKIQRFVEARCPKCYAQMATNPSGGRTRNAVPVTSDHSLHTERYLGCEIVHILEDAINGQVLGSGGDGGIDGGGGHRGGKRGSKMVASSQPAQNPLGLSVQVPSSSSNSKSSPKGRGGGGGAASGNHNPPGGSDSNNGKSGGGGGGGVNNAGLDSVGDISHMLSAFGALESDLRTAAQSNPRKEEEYQVRRLGMTAGDGYVPNAGLTTGAGGRSAQPSLMHTNVIVLCASLRGVRDSLRSATTGQTTPRTLEEDYQSYCFQRIVGHCIQARGGYIHYLDGSEVVAFWGVHRALTSDSFNASSAAALNIQRSTLAFNAAIKKDSDNGDLSLHIPSQPYSLVVDMGIAQGLADVDHPDDNTNHHHTSNIRSTAKEVVQVGSLHVLTDVANQARCLATLSAKLISTSILMDAKTAEHVQMSFLTRWVESVRFVNPASHHNYNNSIGGRRTAESAGVSNSITSSTSASVDSKQYGGSIIPYGGRDPITDIHQLIDVKGDEEWMYAIHNKGGSNRTVTNSSSKGSGAGPSSVAEDVIALVDLATPTGSHKSASFHRNAIGPATVDDDGGANVDPETLNAVELFERAMSLVYNKRQPLEAIALLKKVPHSQPFNNQKSAAAHQMVAAVDDGFGSSTIYSCGLTDLPIEEGGSVSRRQTDEYDAFPPTFLDVPTRFLYRRCVALAQQQKEYTEKQVAKKAVQGMPQRTTVRGGAVATNNASSKIISSAEKNGGAKTGSNAFGTFQPEEIPMTPIRLITSDADPVKAFHWEQP